MDMYEVFAQNPLLAILRNVPKEITLDYAGAILKGGVSVFEVALNSPDALEQITMLRRAYGGQCLIGAGTAITVERAQAALDAGAQFLLTPGTPPEVLAFCRDRNVMLLPHRCSGLPAIRLPDHEAVPRRGHAPQLHQGPERPL